MQPMLRRTRRARRGSNLVEFALIFPIFMALFIGVMEYSWYFYQRGVVVDAARRGCELGTQSDPQDEDVVAIARGAIEERLGAGGGIECGGVHTCGIVIDDLSAASNDPPRLICRVTVNFISLTGYLGAGANSDLIAGPGGELLANRSGSDQLRRVLPSTLRGRSVSVFEDAD